MQPPVYDLLLLNGTIVTPRGRCRADIGVREGKIAGMGTDLAGVPARDRLSVPGCFVLPGCIDAHQHLWEPGMLAGHDFADGTRASVAGGITTIIDQPLSPPEVLDVATFEQKKALG